MGNNKTLDRIFSSKIFWVMASILCALVLWVYVTSTEVAVDTKAFDKVALELTGEDELREARGYVVTSTGVEVVSFSLSGPRRVIASLTRSSLKATVDVSGLKPGTHFLPYNISYPGNVDSSNIRSSGRVSIKIVVDDNQNKSVPVIGLFAGTTAEGIKPISSSDMTFEPASVFVSGPSSEIDKIAGALVVIESENVSKSIDIDIKYTLVDKDNNPIESTEKLILENETVRVILPVKAVKEIPIKLTVYPGGGATEDNLQKTFEPATVEIAGPANVLEGISELNVGQLLLSRIVADGTKAFPIKFGEDMPADVEIITPEKETVLTYKITGLRTTTLTIFNFECVNVPEGYTASVTTKSIDINVRGKPEEISKILASDFRIIVDLADAGEFSGVKVLPVAIDVGDNNVGVLDDSHTAIVELSVDMRDD